MKIERIAIPAPPPEIQMTFPLKEGWAVVAALREWADKHPEAVEKRIWEQWASDLDRELRR